LPFRAAAFVPATQSGRNRASVLPAIKFKKSRARARARAILAARRGKTNTKAFRAICLHIRFNGFFSGYLASETVRKIGYMQVLVSKTA
jgi:hypothetical protein